MRAEGWEARHRYGHHSVTLHILESLIMLRSLNQIQQKRVNTAKIVKVTRKVERQKKRER